MSPYCSAHDEWLIMKPCMYVRYRDANNVSNFGGDPETQLNFKTFYSIIYAVLRTWRPIAAAVATRPREGCSSMEGHTSLSTALVILNWFSLTWSLATFLAKRICPIATAPG